MEKTFVVVNFYKRKKMAARHHHKKHNDVTDPRTTLFLRQVINIVLRPYINDNGDVRAEVVFVGDQTPSALVLFDGLQDTPGLVSFSSLPLNRIISNFDVDSNDDGSDDDDGIDVTDDSDDDSNDKSDDSDDDENKEEDYFGARDLSSYVGTGNLSRSKKSSDRNKKSNRKSSDQSSEKASSETYVGTSDLSKGSIK